MAAEEEAEELRAAAGVTGHDLAAMVARRQAGEPLAWVTGTATFDGMMVAVHRGVYVPRRQSEMLVAAAANRLPAAGTAVDLCTGAGAVAAALARRRPAARVLATDVDAAAAACARANGVAVVVADLAGPLLGALAGRVDVVTAVAPYVPTGALRLLPPDVLTHEPLRALDGGGDGTVVLQRLVPQAALLLRRGGWLLVELGGDQDAILRPLLAAAGFGDIGAAHDEDGDLRSLAARLGHRRHRGSAAGLSGGGGPSPY